MGKKLKLKVISNYKFIFTFYFGHVKQNLVSFLLVFRPSIQ